MVKKMTTQEPLGLVWNQHKENLGTTFQELRKEKDFLDVTLACGDEDIVGHKVVLAASSPFLRRIFQRHPESNHPLVYLNGVDPRLVSTLVDFMYMGEVEVERKHLPAFLKLAKDLQVRGLCGDTKESGDQQGKGGKGVKLTKDLSSGELNVESKMMPGEMCGDLAKSGEVADSIEMEDGGVKLKETEEEVMQRLKEENMEEIEKEDDMEEREENKMEEKEENKMEEEKDEIDEKEENNMEETEDHHKAENSKEVVWSKDKQLNDWIVNNVVKKACSVGRKETGGEEKEVSEEKDENCSDPIGEPDAERLLRSSLRNLRREDQIYLATEVDSGKRAIGEVEVDFPPISDSEKKSSVKDEVDLAKKSGSEKTEKRGGDDLPSGWQRLVHRREEGTKVGR